LWAGFAKTSSALDQHGKINLYKRKRTVLEELLRATFHKIMIEEIRASDLNLSALSIPTY